MSTTATLARHRAEPATSAASRVRTALAWIVLLALVAVVTAGAIVPRLLGAVPLTVLSGSMRPGLQPGDLIVVQPVADAQGIGVGDVITFQPVSDDPTLVTHRVVNLDVHNGEVVGLTTRGDANGANDAPIVPDQVQGKLLYSIPALGYVAHAMGDYRKILVIAVAGVLFAYAAFTLGASAVEARKRRTES